jgi:ketosteroid isomerase-like protein
MATNDTEKRMITVAVAQSYQTLMREGRWDDWSNLWAEDGLLEFPFAPEGRPSSYQGRKAILDYMKGAAGKFTIVEASSTRIQPMLDPEVLCVELAIKGMMTDTGAPYNQKYVVFFVVKDGKLQNYREYWNPLVSMAAHGGYDQWMASLTRDGEKKV